MVKSILVLSNTRNIYSVWNISEIISFLPLISNLLINARVDPRPHMKATTHDAKWCSYLHQRSNATGTAHKGSYPLVTTAWPHKAEIWLLQVGRVTTLRHAVSHGLSALYDHTTVVPIIRLAYPLMIWRTLIPLTSLDSHCVLGLWEFVKLYVYVVWKHIINGSLLLTILRICN